jgi:hypothetical protein
MKLTLNQFILIIISSIVLLWIVVTVHIVYGQDVDPRYYCLYETYPYAELCTEQEIYDLYSQLLERAQEWNNNNTR